MTAMKWNIRAGAYYDSVVLMQLQRGLLGLPGVVDAGVVMATQANRELLAANNLLPDPISASPDDLLIVVKADTEKAAADAIENVDGLLASRRSSTASQDYRPHTLSAAVKQLPEANWVLVSVPGRYAAGVAREALDLGRHVFLYSDNVPLEDEISLKTTARERGLLVMGPDCGTAILNGIGLGFANRVRRGSIGVVGASGTGIQAVTTHIHNLGGGISQAIGTGSRDLRSEVGAITATQALEVLRRDPETKVIVLVSKPPSPEVAAQLIATAEGTGKPIVVYFIGRPPPARRIGDLQFAVSLSEAAELALQLTETAASNSSPAPAGGTNSYVRGLFSGGTLAYESLLGLQALLAPLYSNMPGTGSRDIKDPLHSEAHTILDLGDEFFMVGRLHPMIDNDLRLRRMRQESADPQVGMILLDVVLGQGSHPDPAGELAPVIREIKGRRNDIEVAAIVVGTEADAQNPAAQIGRLSDAGARIFQGVTEAVAYISLRFGHPAPNAFPTVDLEQFSQPLAGINVGLESFHESLIAQGAQAVQMEWRPPAGGNQNMAALLARMKK